MNNDRLLTRVFDRQTKRMIYQGDFFPGEDGDELMFIGLSLALGVDELAILGSDKDGYVTDISAGDRFVPMMCMGKHDIKGKLTYEGDVLRHAISRSKFWGIIKWDEKSLRFRLFIVNGCRESSFSNIDINECEIIGHKFEQPELLEVKA